MRGYPGMSLEVAKFLPRCNYYHYHVRTSVQNQNQDISFMKHSTCFWNHNFELEDGPLHYTFGSICKAKEQTRKVNYQWKMKPEAFRLTPSSGGHLFLEHARSWWVCLQNPELDSLSALWAFRPSWHLKARPRLLKIKWNGPWPGSRYLNCDYGIISQSRGLSSSVQRSHFHVYFLSHQNLHSCLGSWRTSLWFLCLFCQSSVYLFVYSTDIYWAFTMCPCL